MIISSAYFIESVSFRYRCGFVPSIGNITLCGDACSLFLGVVLNSVSIVLGMPMLPLSSLVSYVDWREGIEPSIRTTYWPRRSMGWDSLRLGLYEAWDARDDS